MKAHLLLLLFCGAVSLTACSSESDSSGDDDAEESSSSGSSSDDESSSSSGGKTSSGGSSSSGGKGASSGSSSGGSSGAATAKCLEGYRVLESGDSVTFDSAPAGTGNDLKEYCLMIADEKLVKIFLDGGDCGQFECMGEDVHILLRAGSPPEDFGDDGESTEWTYGPGPNSVGEYGKGVRPGAVYLTTYDDANTLGYSDVTLRVEIE